jgi:small conductance mechanosensitive channel
MPLDLSHLGDLLVIYGVNGFGALCIALIGWWASGFAERLTRRALATSHMDTTVGAFMSSLARYTVLIVTFVLVLQVIGIQATSLVAVLGAASLAIGLALQGTLSNMAAGVMLLLFRPFRIGDSVEVAGKSGTVKNLNLFMTELASGDNIQVLIPNGQVWGTALTNMSAYPTRQVSIRFPVGLDKDLEAISSDIRAWLEQDPRVLKTPPASVTTSGLTDKGLELSVQAWSKSEDASSLRADLIRNALLIVQELTAPVKSEAEKQGA